MQRAFTAIKEHSSIAYAKVATIGGFCDLNLIIVKATSPDDLPPPERYVNELLKIFSISPSSFRSFSLGFTRRFSKTQCWRVALKCLILLHRLLRLLPQHSPFRTELFQTRSNGTLSLYPCQFRDSSSSSYSEDYTIFIRSYAQLLDEALDCFSFDEGEEKYYVVKEQEQEEEEPKNFQERMKEVGRLLELLPQRQSLIDRVMGCKPSGSAAQNLLVRTAMRLAIRESFVCYTSFRKEVAVVLENLLQMPNRNCVAAFGIYKKASIQASQLSHFYEWCKFKGLCGPYESPMIDQIRETQVQALETFLNGMWQLTDIESYSSSSSSITTTESIQTSLLDSSSSTSAEDDSEKKEKRLEVVVSNQWVKFEESPLPEKLEMCDKKLGLLIQLDDDDDDEAIININERPLMKLDNDDDDDEAIININDGWEAILEASIGSQSFAHSTNNLFFNPNIGHGNGWEMQVYNPPALNPFHHPHNVSLQSGK